MLMYSKLELPEELISLDISERNFTDTHQEDLIYFPNLQIINSNKNFLNMNHFFNLNSLKELSLQESKIYELPPLLGQLKKLEKLNLGFNYISDFTQLIHLPMIRILCLASNNLEFIPRELVELTYLEELDLSFNLISDEQDLDLWSIIGAMKNLNILSLNNN